MGRWAPVRSTAVASSAGSGLPATRGVTPVVRATTSTNAPLPGAGPRAVGSVLSTFVATQGRPRRTATHASSSIAHDSSGEKPCTTATGSASTRSTGVSPTARTASRSPSAPTTSTRAAPGTSAASNRAAAWALVTTSSSRASIASDVRCRATWPGVREALLVTKATHAPRRRSSPSVSTGSRHRLRARRRPPRRGRAARRRGRRPVVPGSSASPARATHSPARSPRDTCRARSVARACRSRSVYSARSGRMTDAMARCSTPRSKRFSRVRLRPRAKWP